MRRLGLIAGLLAFLGINAGAFPVISYVQVSTGPKQSGGFNLQTSTLTKLCFDDASCSTTANVSSGYALQPATVTIQAAQGINGPTATFTLLTASTESVLLINVSSITATQRITAKSFQASDTITAVNGITANSMNANTITVATITLQNVIKDGALGNNIFNPGNAINGDLFVGLNSGALGLGGVANTGIGFNTLSNLTSGSANTGVGNGALQLIDAGSSNTGVGLNALAGISGGNGNTALGTNAGEFFTALNSSSDTFIGFNAEQANVGALTNAIAIGANATVSANNTAVMGGAPGTYNTLNLIVSSASLAALTVSSSGTFSGNVNFSSGVLLSGASGLSGQVFTSGGPGAVSTWQTASGSGSGIVSPGTFTWTNTFGLSLSTVSVSSASAFSGQVAISSYVSITSTFSVPALKIAANGTYGTTNGSSGGFFMDCTGGGATSGYCSQFYTNAGAQSALGGVINVVINNPAWNQPSFYSQNPNNTSNNNADILVDDNFTPAIAIRETSQSNPSAKKWQYSAHGGVMRFENRANDDSGFLPYMQISSQTFWNDIYVGRTYGNQSNFAQFGIQSDTGNVYGLTLTTSTSNVAPYLITISTLGVTALQKLTVSSGTAFSGNVIISSTVALSNGAGSSGQAFTSGGPGTVPSWTTISAAGGGIVSPGTFTWTNTFGESVSTLTVTSTATISAAVVTGSITLSGAIISNLTQAPIFYLTGSNTNVWVGNNSGNYTGTGLGNIGVGGNNFLSFSTGAANVALGASANAAITTGSNNTAVGNSAMNGLGTGNANVAIGANAASAITNGSSNTFVGYNANTSNNAILNGIAIGANSTVATNNTAVIGGSAGTFNTMNLIVSSATIVSVAASTVTTSSHTNTGAGGFQVIAFSSPTEKANTIDNPLVHILLESAIATYPGAQTDGLFVDVLDTGTNTNPLNDMIAIHGLARQFSTSNSQIIGGWFDAYGQGSGAPNIAAIYAVPAWASDLTGGTTSPIIGIVITPRVTSLDGLTNKSTGTVMGIEIPDFTVGHGDVGKSWPLYIPNPYPSYFNGPIGIRRQNPVANFEVGVDSTTQYAMIIATETFGNSNQVLNPSQYVFSVSSNGVVNSHGTHNFLSSFIAQSSGALSGNFDIGVATTSTISSQLIVSATPTLTYAMVIGTGPSVVNGTMGTDKYILTLTTSGALNATQGIAANALFATNGSTSSQLSVTGVTNIVGTTTISGLLSPLEFTGGTSAGAGINIQAPIISGAGFQRGFISNNLTFNGGTSLWVAGNNFGTDAASMFFAGGGINFNAFNNLSLPTTLTNTQYTNGTIMFIYPGPAGAGGAGGGVNIGSNANPTTGLSVVSSSGANVTYGLTVGTLSVSNVNVSSYTATFSTTTSGPYILDISSTGHINTQQVLGATVTSCGANASLIGSDVAGVITTGAASPTACTLTFNRPYANTPVCLCGANGATACDPTSTSATGVTFTLGITQTSIKYICIGRD